MLLEIITSSFFLFIEDISITIKLVHEGKPHEKNDGIKQLSENCLNSKDNEHREGYVTTNATVYDNSISL